MKNDRKVFTLLECVMVVAILLFVATMAIQALVHSVSVWEKDTAHAAATDYSALRNVYAEHYRAVPAGVSGENSTGASIVFSAQAH